MAGRWGRRVFPQKFPRLRRGEFTRNVGDAISVALDNFYDACSRDAAGEFKLDCVADGGGRVAFEEIRFPRALGPARCAQCGGVRIHREIKLAREICPPACGDNEAVGCGGGTLRRQAGGSGGRHQPRGIRRRFFQRQPPCQKAADNDRAENNEEFDKSFQFVMGKFFRAGNFVPNK